MFVARDQSVPFFKMRTAVVAAAEGAFDVAMGVATSIKSMTIAHYSAVVNAKETNDPINRWYDKTPSLYCKLL